MSKEEEAIDNANLNKKVKKIEIGQELTNTQRKLYLVIILTLLVLTASCFALKAVVSTRLYKISNLQNEGFTLIGSFPSISIGGFGVLREMSDLQSNSQQFSTDIYHDIIGDIDLISSKTYVGNVDQQS